MRQAEAYFLRVLNLQGHGPDQLAVNCSTGRWEGTEERKPALNPAAGRRVGRKSLLTETREFSGDIKQACGLTFLCILYLKGMECLLKNVWYTEARLLCSWPKSSRKQQAHFTNTATKTCILKNKVIFHWSPALLTAPFKWPVPNDSVWYDLAYLKRSACNKIPHWEVVWAHTTPGIFLWPQLPVQDSCFENGRDLVFLALLCDGRKL